ncbi:hypothetical protein OUZ56_005309 [Daphnia magna]|uniref:Uncharacterized protein n=1 Tax=Daphnia magna TaxID=35525 RepID=A0ABQ9YSG7_9CRUS|nr:hypothetical protein OUZ56_005309 [Daphnia magna]
MITILLSSATRNRFQKDATFLFPSFKTKQNSCICRLGMSAVAAASGEMTYDPLYTILHAHPQDFKSSQLQPVSVYWSRLKAKEFKALRLCRITAFNDNSRRNLLTTTFAPPS